MIVPIITLTVPESQLQGCRFYRKLEMFDLHFDSLGSNSRIRERFHLWFNIPNFLLTIQERNIKWSQTTEQVDFSIDFT